MDNEKLKILIVDDEPDILEILKINLENTNWNYPTPISFGIDRVKELSLFIDELKISNTMFLKMEIRHI